MTRTIITISDKEKAWIFKQAKKENISMAELIRRALAFYEKNAPPCRPSRDFENALLSTIGIWKKEDGLTYQKKLRDEW